LKGSFCCSGFSFCCSGCCCLWRGSDTVLIPPARGDQTGGAVSAWRAEGRTNVFRLTRGARDARSDIVIREEKQNGSLHLTSKFFLLSCLTAYKSLQIVKRRLYQTEGEVLSRLSLFLSLIFSNYFKTRFDFFKFCEKRIDRVIVKTHTLSLTHTHSPSETRMTSLSSSILILSPQSPPLSPPCLSLRRKPM
jgi:hypothetical protein